MKDQGKAKKDRCVKINLSMSAEQKAKLDVFGGSRWVQQQLDKMTLEDFYAEQAAKLTQIAERKTEKVRAVYMAAAKAEQEARDAYAAAKALAEESRKNAGMPAPPDAGRADAERTVTH